MPLLALLKHPLAAAGMAPAALRQAARGWKSHALRGPRPAPGFAGLREALGGRRRQASIVPLVDRLARMARAAGGIAGKQREAPLLGADRCASRAFAEALAATDEQPGAARLWAGEAGEAVANFVAELRESAARSRRRVAAELSRAVRRR